MSISKQITTVAIMMTVGLVSLSARPAFAVKQFYDEFKEVYAGDGGLDLRPDQARRDAHQS